MSSASRMPSSTSRTRRRSPGSWSAIDPTRSQTAPPSPTSTAPSRTRPRPCAVNDEGAGVLAAAAAQAGASVLYPSSDYVFDGRQRRPYVEADMTRAISAYGRSKQAGETSVAAANPRHFIVRASWLFGVGGGNFVETMLRIGSEQPEVVVVSDQVGCPTYTGHLAKALAELIEGDEFGMHHIAGAGEASWFDFAQEIFDQADVDCRVLGGRPRCSARPAPRPELLGSRDRARGRPGGSRTGETGSRPTSPSASASGRPREAPRRGRGRLHRLGLRALSTRPSPGRHRAGARQAHLRGPLGEPEGRRPERLEIVEGDIADPDAVEAAIEGVATRSSTSPPSPTSTARSNRRASSSRPTCSARSSCSRTPRVRRGSGISRSRPTRSTARSRADRSPRRRRSTRRRRTRRRRPVATCSSARSTTPTAPTRCSSAPRTTTARGSIPRS